ncbi:hypothetical protein CJ030_MR5G024497 [Morella rubra]|uniref:Uncharacterized protein n=1 Tax=Morella rubra TaxID=262757 RepID=A0A6A1VQK0_9ROSI|nr:hypothetical protein CJ030_MR5G024497 [Morella rubra]
MGDISTPRSGINLCYRTGNPEEPRVHTSASPGCGTPRRKNIDGVAAWLCQSIATVFFASLERCSCFYVDTKDDSDHSDCSPMILNDGLKESSGAENQGKQTDGFLE